MCTRRLLAGHLLQQNEELGWVLSPSQTFSPSLFPRRPDIITLTLPASHLFWHMWFWQRSATKSAFFSPWLQVKSGWQRLCLCTHTHSCTLVQAARGSQGGHPDYCRSRYGRGDPSNIWPLCSLHMLHFPMSRLNGVAVTGTAKKNTQTVTSTVGFTHRNISLRSVLFSSMELFQAFPAPPWNGFILLFWPRNAEPIVPFPKGLLTKQRNDRDKDDNNANRTGSNF